MPEGRWAARFAGFVAALVWHGAIVAALVWSARPGAALSWSTVAHSTVPPRQAVFAEAITLAPDTIPADGARPQSDRVTASDTVSLALKMAASEAESELRKEPAVSVVANAVPAARGDAPIHCEVHIHQDVRGRVQAIDFALCTAT